MADLHLNARVKHHNGSVDARLLMYEGEDFPTGLFDQDIRQLLNDRPTTGSIFILAPEVCLDGLKAALAGSAALRRAKNVFERPENSFRILYFDRETRSIKNSSIYRDTDLDVDTEIDLQTLQSGWLFDLFDSMGGMVIAPPGLHFGKTSGRHSERFLRTANVLLSSAICVTLSFFTLPLLKSKYAITRVLVDTSSLLSVVQTLSRLCVRYGIWNTAPRSVSFGSYGGLIRIGEARTRDLVIISSSTSGGLKTQLSDRGFKADQIVTLFYLCSQKSFDQTDDVLCNLTLTKDRLRGYASIESYSHKACRWCKEGIPLAEFEGDQFLLQKRAVQKLDVTGRSQSPDARKTLEVFTRKKLIWVRLRNAESGVFRFRDVEIRLPNFVSGKSNCKISRDIERLILRFAPIDCHYIVTAETQQPGQQLTMIRDGSEGLKSARQIIDGQMSTAQPVNEGGALIWLPVLEDHARTRAINQAMRSLVPGGRVAYLAGLFIAETQNEKRDLSIFLEYGERGKETFLLRYAFQLMLPTRMSERSPWEMEMEVLREISEEEDCPQEITERMDFLAKTNSSIDRLFWPGSSGELQINRDWIFLDTKDENQLSTISQADVFAVVSNALACARHRDVGLEALFSDNHTTLLSSVHSAVVLNVENFRRYNDSILQAALIRAAHATELHFEVDFESSREMTEIIMNQIDRFNQAAGEALAEFILALACQRLRLKGTHRDRIVNKVASNESIPSHIKSFAKVASRHTAS
jgi:hypothetical protein